MTEPFPSRPHYVHQQTYLRLRDRYEAAMEQYVGPMAAWLEKRGGPFRD